MKRNPLHLYGTLGPSACQKDTLKNMFQVGMTGVRLNLSHKSLEDCKDWLIQLREAAFELHIVPELLVDLQGSELRIGTLAAPLSLKKEQSVLLLSEKEKENVSSASATIPIPDVLFPYLKKGQLFTLDDGKIQLEISDESPLKAIVKTGGLLHSKKSIAIEGISIPMPTLTSMDLKNIQDFHRYGVTGVMLPFVQNKEDLIELKRTLLQYHLENIRIFAKIESMEGLSQLPSLLPHCDEIVIARGDLGNAMPLPKLPAVQKQIALTCRRTKTPFMVVTELLASMQTQPVPTRAEVTDIFQAVLDGASSLMLTGETAIGNYPEDAMKVLSDTAFEGLRYKMESKFM